MPRRPGSPDSVPDRDRRFRRLQLELLERRDLLASFVWDPPGGGAGAWSDPKSWGSYVGSPEELRQDFPGPEDYVSFPQSQTAATVSLNSHVRVRGLSASNSVTFSGGKLEVIEDASFYRGSSSISDGELIVGEDLKLEPETELSISGLLNVGGYLAIDEEASVDVGDDANVEGDLYLYDDSSLDVDDTLTVGFRVLVEPGARLSADDLSTGNDLDVHSNATVTVMGTIEVGRHADLRAASVLRPLHLIVHGGLEVTGTSLHLPGDLQVDGNLSVEDGEISAGGTLQAYWATFRRSDALVEGDVLVPTFWATDSSIVLSGELVAVVEFMLDRSELTVAPQASEGTQAFFGELILDESKASFHNTHVTVARNDNTGDVWINSSSTLSVTASASDDDNLRGAFTAQGLLTSSTGGDKELKLTFRNVATSIGLLDVEVAEGSSLEVEGGKFIAQLLYWKGPTSLPPIINNDPSEFRFHRADIRGVAWTTYFVELDLWKSSLVVQYMEARSSVLQVTDGSTLEVQQSLFISGATGGSPPTRPNLVVAAEGIVVVGSFGLGTPPVRTDSSVHVHPNGKLHLLSGWIEAARLFIKHYDQPGTEEPLRGSVLAVGTDNQLSGSLKNDGLLSLIGPTTPDPSDTWPVAGRLKVGDFYDQETKGILELPSRGSSPGTMGAPASLEVLGNADLAGMVRLVDTGFPIGGAAEEKLPHGQIGERNNLIQLRGRTALTGRFEFQEGLARKLHPYMDDNTKNYYFQEYPHGLDTSFFAIHYDPNNAVIQSYVVEAPRLIGANNGTAAKRLTSSGELVNGAVRNMVLVAPGSAANADGWVKSLADDIRNATNATNTDVVTLDWSPFATGIAADRVNPEWAPWTASTQAISIGESFGFWLREIGHDDLQHVHFLSHSAGSWLVDAISDTLKVLESNAFRHVTLFDAFTPGSSLEAAVQFLPSWISQFSTEGPISKWGSEKPWLGDSASFAEHYIDSRMAILSGLAYLGVGQYPAVPFTDSTLRNAFNVDVTRLQVSEWATLGMLEYKSGEHPYQLDSHAYPHQYYSQSIPGAAGYIDRWTYGFRNSYEYRQDTALLTYGVRKEKGSRIRLPSLQYTPPASFAPLTLSAENSIASPPASVTFDPAPGVAAEMRAAGVGGTGVVTTEFVLATALEGLEATFEFPDEVGGVLRISVDGVEVQVIVSPFFDEPLAGVFTTGWISLGQPLPAGKHTVTFTLEPYDEEEARVQIHDLVLGTVDGWHSGWHNPAEPADVTGDDDGKVDILDLLAVVNWLVRNRGDSALPLDGDPSQLGYVDVNDDGKADILDLLAVVNVLVRRAHQSAGGEGEGELIVEPAAEAESDPTSIVFAAEGRALREVVPNSHTDWGGHWFGSESKRERRRIPTHPGSSSAH